MTAFFRRWVGSWSDFEFEALEVLDAGAALVLDIRERGRGIGSGVPMEHRHAMVWHFLSNRIVRITSYETKEQAIEAAGLRG